MKLTINKNRLSMDPEFFMRRHFSYIMINSRHTGKDSFVRKLTGNRYPRLHMYLKEAGDSLTFDLHLDQKEVSYGGNHAHNAEYDGKVVEDEINRLKETLGVEGNDNVPASSVQKKSTGSNSVAEQKKALDQIGVGSYDKAATLEKKSFWQKLFS